MFAKLLKEQTHIVFISRKFKPLSLVLYVKIFIWMNPVLVMYWKALASSPLQALILQNLIKNPHKTWTRTAYWFVLLHAGRKTFTCTVISAVLSWPVWLKYTKNKVSVGLMSLSRIRMTELKRLLTHLAFWYVLKSRKCVCADMLGGMAHASLSHSLPDLISHIHHYLVQNYSNT